MIYPLIMSCSVTCSAWKLTAKIINIEFSALSEKGKKYFNLEAYAHELEEKGRYAVCNNGMFKL
ncbi:hypothetical protein [Blautia wexlerae]|uniref:hypothetical protein n=1 Tax=Blautia wexlerae TaxID=418240 RepID=UPI0034A3A1AD